MKKQGHDLLTMLASNSYFQNLFSSTEKIGKNQKIGQIQIFRLSSTKMPKMLKKLIKLDHRMCK